MCEGFEDSINCAIDCGAPPFCGDGTCNGDEDQCSCPADCGTPPATETDCSDGLDNDCDNFVDCDDTNDCTGDPSCDEPVCEDISDRKECINAPGCRWDNRNKQCL